MTTSDHFWRTCIHQVARKLSKKVQLSSDAYDEIADQYESKDGSWEALARSDVDSWGLLREVCQDYFKEQHDDGTK